MKEWLKVPHARPYPVFNNADSSPHLQGAQLPSYRKSPTTRKLKLAHHRMEGNLVTSASEDSEHLILKGLPGTSLVAQWLRILLPMQGTQVRALVRKISHAAEQLSPCTTTTEPELWSPRATTTEPACHSY